MAGGRPSSYRDTFPDQARKLCLLGATDQEIADFFEVDVRTIHRWKGDHEEFCHALKVGKEAADTRVERSLYQQAIGYEQDEVKIFMPANAEAPVYAPFKAKVAPNATATIFWLKNRRKEEWRDRSQVELSATDDAAALLAEARERRRLARLAEDGGTAEAE
jgi:hypothetical protein